MMIERKTKHLADVVNFILISSTMNHKNKECYLENDGKHLKSDTILSRISRMFGGAMCLTSCYFKKPRPQSGPCYHLVYLLTNRQPYLGIL